MRVLFVLAMCALSVSLVATAPVQAMPICSPVHALQQGGPDEAAKCIERNLNPCHFAYPHPCA